jgi:hypothetical protein
MLCRNCWVDTWEGTHCKECGRRLSTQRSIKQKLMHHRDAVVTRRRAYLFTTGLLVSLIAAPVFGEEAPYLAAFSGLMLGWLLSIVGALQPYDECYCDFWETYGGGSRALGPVLQQIVALLRRDGLTNFMILELVLIVWNAVMFALNHDYFLACFTINGAAATVAWVFSTFLRRTWY